MHSKNQKRHSSPIPSRSPLVPMKPKVPAVAPAVAPSPKDSLPFRVPKDYPHSRFSKAPLAVYPPKGGRSKTCVSLPVVSLEKIPCLSRGDSSSHVRLNSSSSSSTLSPLKASSFTPASTQRTSEKLANGRGSSGPSTPRSITPPSSLDRRPSPARSPLDRRAAPSPSTQDKKSSPSPSYRPVALPALTSAVDKNQQNGAKNPVKSQKRLSGRVFDPDKHCGVPDPETKRSCTRSLTCKTHSLTQRRAVPGRSRLFDVLLAEHKGLAKEREALKEKEREAVKEREKEGAQRAKEACNQSTTPREAACPSRPQCPSERPLSSLKLRLANAHIPRAPGSSSSTSAATLLPSPAPPTLPSHPEPSPQPWNVAGDGTRLSSDEGDAEPPDDTDRTTFHCSSRHPRPAGLCVFSSRLMGRGFYVFDRRWDRMRLVLQSMVEKHLNAQMWRKVPLAAESLSSLSPSAAPLVTSHQAPPSDTVTSAAAQPSAFSVRHSLQAHAHGSSRNASHKSSRPSKDAKEPTEGTKKRKSLSFSASSSPFQTVSVHKRNGSSFPPAPQTSGVAAAASGRSKKSGRGERADDWLSRADGSLSSNLHNSRELCTSSISCIPREPASVPHQPTVAPPGPLAYGGGAEGRKRRSPSSYKGKASKLSRPGGFQSLFGKGSDNGGLLVSGPDSPRQAKMHH